jgi:hypothetical protein
MVTEEMIEHMGGPAGIADALKAFEELDARFDVERPRFAEQYPDQWVAMTAGGLMLARCHQVHQMDNRVLLPHGVRLLEPVLDHDNYEVAFDVLVILAHESITHPDGA